MGRTLIKKPTVYSMNSSDITKLFITKIELSAMAGVTLKVLRKEIQPLIEKGLVQWEGKVPGQKGGRKIVTAHEAKIIISYLNEGITP